MKAQETKDAELLALSALVLADVLMRLETNMDRFSHSQSMAYFGEGFHALDYLRRELVLRGVIAGVIEESGG